MITCIWNDDLIYIPQTINVKLAPFFATILCRWLGRLAIPVPVDVIGTGGGCGATSMGEEAVIMKTVSEREASEGWP